MLIWGRVGMASDAPKVEPTLIEQSRGVMKVHCGACHYPVPVDNHPNATKVFDLSHARWSDTLSEKQLKNVVRRFKDRSTMTEAELKEVVPRGMKPPSHPSKSEIRLIEKYIERELQTRLINQINAQ